MMVDSVSAMAREVAVNKVDMMRKEGTVESAGYAGLFGEAGLALPDAHWIDRANRQLPPNLSALGAKFIDCSRIERWLRVSYEPGPRASNLLQVTGGAIAEMLDQTAAYCGSLVTGFPCPTLSMTVTILRGGTAKSYIARARLLNVTTANAVLSADLDDDAGMRIASITVVSQLVTLNRLG
ncbi:hypothetical protein MSAS_47470 [Mycobacterium saskatchewanense]|uniref:PaaI family thioesterase n=1 Tax=Mycobacterium saskatchewanense TaxID=220927 RepID=UPI0013023AB5|nr:PaaI family thioesterase [Mycobacterium saskatchewanense]BBX65573.1 hypothetical protein MSAS_47470 [Mycobacterium saskatchewanense]